MAALALLACQPESTTTVRIEPEGRFFHAPFPIPYRERGDRTLDVSDFPTGGNQILGRVVQALETQRVGFGCNTGMWFPLSGSLNPSSLPQSLERTLSFDSPVYLVNVDVDSPHRGRFTPVETSWKEQGETHSPAGLLVVLPVQGAPLEPDTWYAAVLTRGLHDMEGRPLARSPFLRQGGGGERGARLGQELDRLWQLLGEQRRHPDEVVGATVFRTGAPTAVTTRLVASLGGRPVPGVRNLRLTEQRPTFSVLEAEVELPLFQRGEKPFTQGGEIAQDAFGAPVEQGREWVQIALSVPTGPMPVQGFPLLLHAAGSGGDHRTPIQGPRSPAAVLAPRGIAVLGAMPHLTGSRHPSGDPSGNIVFNVFNPLGVVGNFQQSVLEQSLLIDLMSRLRIPVELTPGVLNAPDVRFDPERVYLHGQSTGSVVAALSLGVEPRLRAGLLTGAGGSWLYTLVLKQSPPTSTLVRTLLEYRPADEVDPFDPALHLAATLWEPLEPMNHARLWGGDRGGRPTPASVFLVGGVLDTFFPPPMLNALAASAPLDLVGAPVEPTLAAALAQRGGAEVSAPLRGNRTFDGHPVTHAMVHYRAGAGRDGHFVAFDQIGPAHQYACFLSTALPGQAPVVPLPAGAVDATCE